MLSSSDSVHQESWTCFKGSCHRTGRSNFAFLRKPLFKSMIKVGPLLSSPVSESHSVYVCTITGRVYRIEKGRNIIKWHVNMSSPVVSSPSIYKNHLIVGTFSSWIHGSGCDREPSSVSAFNLYDAAEKWKYELPKGVFSSICSIENIHVFGCLDGKVYALSNEGNPKWYVWTEGEVWCSPSSDGQTIFIGSDDGRLYALDLDGKTIWKTKLAGKVRSSSPCLSKSPDNFGLPSIYIGTQSGHLYRISKDNGAVLWSTNLGSPLLSSPSLIQSYVLIGSSDGYLNCLRTSNGSVIWRFRTADKVWSSPLLTRDLKVFVGSLDSHIYQLNIVTGQLIWKFPTMGMIDSSPSLSGGTLIVGSRDGYLYFFDQSNRDDAFIG